MSISKKPYYTEAEYLAFAEEQDIKYEYVDGMIVAMAGGTYNHSRIGANVTYALIGALRDKNCTVCNSDLKLKAAHSHFFPDGMVICGEPVMDEQTKHAVINPTLIVEVLSESTESYDRGQKFMHYRQLDSLQGYLLIAQDLVHIDAYHRSAENQWVLTDAIRMEQEVHIPSLDIRLTAADVYNKITFPESPSPTVTSS